MLAKRLKLLREHKHISQAELANTLDVAQQTVASWERDKSSPNYDILQRIADYFHVSTDYLLGHESEAQAINAKFPFIALPNDKNYIPVLGSVKCGLNAPNDEAIEEYIGIDDKYRADEMKAFIAEGDSMEGDNIFEGDICIIHLQDEVPDGAIAVCVIDGVEGTMKHVHRDNGVIVLQSSNPKYPPQIFAGEDANRVRVVGELVELRRNVKNKLFGYSEQP